MTARRKLASQIQIGPGDKRLHIILLCVFLLVGSVLLSYLLKGEKLCQDSFFVMDTYASVSVSGRNGETAVQTAREYLKRLEGLWSVTDPDSEIYRINHSGENTKVSEETARLLAFALQMAERTNGAFDPTLYPILRAWGFTTDQNRIPSQEERNGLLERVGYEKVALADDRVSLPEGSMLDLGGVAKGYAGQLVAASLRESGVGSALLDIGGNVQAVGARPDGSPWQVGLRDPLSEGLIGQLSITDLAVVTSGSYERFFIGDDGNRYGHILDPKTGCPVDNDLLSVTVIAPDGGLCDALSTALFVMGREKAAAHWEQYRDFELILITGEKEIWLTPGAKDIFTLADGQGGWKIREISGNGLTQETAGERSACLTGELFVSLEKQSADSPFVSARIAISDYGAKETSVDGWETDLRFDGDAEVVRRSYLSLQEMQTTLDGEREAAKTGWQPGTIRLLYVSFPMAGLHALDLYRVLSTEYAAAGQTITVSSADGGNAYFFTREKTEADGQTMLSFWDAAVNLIVKDGYAYALLPESVPKDVEEEELQLFFRGFYRHFAGDLWGWCLDEENLYWIDHTDRLTRKENPTRSFLEVRGVDENQDDSILRYFGLLKSAEYRIPLDHRTLSVSFTLEQEETAPDPYCYDLLNGSCKDEPYTMTVKDSASGELLQEKSVSLCIELPDTVAFMDLDGDGHSDMRIEAPVHESGMRPQIVEYSPPSYLLWDPEKSEFAYRTRKEILNRMLANQNGLTPEEQERKSQQERPDPFLPRTVLAAGESTESFIRLIGGCPREYNVQKGDSLWRISRDRYGTGTLWNAIIRERGTAEDPNLLWAGETVYLPEILYLPRDPNSRGGLRSEGSFRIELPDGFSHYFLAPDNVRYLPYEEENVIYSLPVENPTGEDALAKDAEWAAFQEEAARCAQALCPGRISDLCFEKYSLDDGSGLYGYSFFYDTGDRILEYVDFFRLGRDNMAEVIGVREQEPNTVLRDTVRYMAASFTDYGGRPGVGWGDDSGPNVGSEEWNYPYLHNLFAAASQQFG